MNPFHPELRRAARLLPRGMIRPRTLKMVRAGNSLNRPRPVPGVTITELPELRLRVYRPDGATNPGPALLWMHAGGMVLGRARDEDAFIGPLARELGIVVASVDYRLAPEDPFPAALDDCYAGLAWLHGNPAVDPLRVAIGGGSAGGGLAAGLAQVAVDRAEYPVAFQLLIYPMLDDRSAVDPGIPSRDFRLWDQTSNHFGWRSYLGAAPGGLDVTAPAAPARREDLAGLPPAWIGVGSKDLFCAEDLAYSRRLQNAGVPCDLVVVEGAFHGFDRVAPKAPIVKNFYARLTSALRTALKL